MTDLDQIYFGVTSGDKQAVSRLFNLLEDRRVEKIEQVAGVLDRLYERSLPRGHVVGITGPPGSGKSTLLSRLIQKLREGKKTVGLIAIDPSSRLSGGALLGDRIRLQYDAGDPGVFVRSIASRGAYGGVSDRTFAGVIVLRGAFDMVFVETVGVGQSETEIAGLVDTMLLVIQPGSGDLLQFLKAGIMEIPHVLTVNKSDMGEPARKTLNEVRTAIEHLDGEASGWRATAMGCSALDGTGISELLKTCEQHREHLISRDALTRNRERQTAEWIAQTTRVLYGERGIERFGGVEKIRARVADNSKDEPFKTLRQLNEEIEATIFDGRGDGSR